MGMFLQPGFLKGPRMSIGLTVYTLVVWEDSTEVTITGLLQPVANKEQASKYQPTYYMEIRKCKIPLLSDSSPESVSIIGTLKE